MKTEADWKSEGNVGRCCAELDLILGRLHKIKFEPGEEWEVRSHILKAKAILGPVYERHVAR